MSNPSIMTQSASKKIRDHVLKEVIGLIDDNLLMKVINSNGMNSIDNILSLRDKDIDTFKDVSVDNPGSLRKHHLQIL